MDGIYFGTFDGGPAIPPRRVEKKRRPIWKFWRMDQLDEVLRNARGAREIMGIIYDLEYFEAPNYWIRHARIFLDDALRRQGKRRNWKR